MIHISIYIISILSSDPSCGQIVGTWDSQPLGQHRRSRVQVAPNALHHLFLFQGLVNPAVPIKGKMVKIILVYFGDTGDSLTNYQLPRHVTSHHGLTMDLESQLGSSPVHRWRPSRGLADGNTLDIAGHGWTTGGVQPPRDNSKNLKPSSPVDETAWRRDVRMSSESNALWLMEVIQLKESWDVLGAVGAFRICILQVHWQL